MDEFIGVCYGGGAGRSGQENRERVGIGGWGLATKLLLVMCPNI